MKESFIFLKEYKEGADSLNDKQKLEFYENMINYALYQKEPIFSCLETKAMFILIKDKLEKTNSSFWNYKERTGSKYRFWKKSVLKRDLYTCQKCGNGDDLVVHHIKGFADNEKLRYDLKNGITLCKECHKEVHKNER